jgi:RHS repeat-associated protein
MAILSRPVLLGADVQQSLLFAIGRGPARMLAYDPFGNQPQRLSGLGFTGQLRESPSQHYLLGNGHRSYSPVFRRFLSPDQLSPFRQGGINSYAYCTGDPVNATDPSGRISVFRPALAVAAGVAIGGGALMIWGDEHEPKVGLTMLILGVIGAASIFVAEVNFRRTRAARIAGESPAFAGNRGAMDRRVLGRGMRRGQGTIPSEAPPSYQAVIDSELPTYEQATRLNRPVGDTAYGGTGMEEIPLARLGFGSSVYNRHARVRALSVSADLRAYR